MMMMTWLGNVNRYMPKGCIGTDILYVYRNRQNVPVQVVLLVVHLCVMCNYRSESLRKLCVAYNNVFFYRKITFLH